MGEGGQENQGMNQVKQVSVVKCNPKIQFWVELRENQGKVRALQTMFLV